ncbi:MAG: hypothetical protein MUD17_10330 [Gemmatimonadaceae bacterium]|nr:hypothetical protein [Gemmatimonadaceae bacterium]
MMRWLPAMRWPLAAVILTPSVIAAQPTLSRRDSIEVARVVWQVAARAPGRPAQQPVRLWIPTSSDSTREVRFSPEARDALQRAGLPVVATPPSGRDTTVVTFADLRPAAGTQGTRTLSVRLRSTWRHGTECVVQSTNLELFTVRRRATGWVAERDPSVIHGDTECQRTP